MLTHMPYLGSEFDPLQRPLYHIAMSCSGSTGRHAPYGEYTGIPDLRSAPTQHHYDTSSMPNELAQDLASSQNKRRINIACARCRKRKIRCSGDPGDGSRCQACKSSGADSELCLFTRVNSKEMGLKSPVPLHQPTPQAYIASPPASLGQANDSTYFEHRQPVTCSSMQPFYVSSYAPNPYDPGCPDYGLEGAPDPQVMDGSRQWTFVEPVEETFPVTCAGQYRSVGPSYHTALPYRMTSPYSMATLQSSLPPPERRLPIPNLQVSTTPLPTSDALRRSLASGSMGGYHGNSWSTSPEMYARRQSSIHDLAHASSLMQPITTRLIESSPSTSPSEGTIMGYGCPDRSAEVNATMTSGPSQTYSTGPILPPLITPANRYAPLPPSHTFYDDRSGYRRDSDTSTYSWRPATASSRDPGSGSTSTSDQLVSGEPYAPVYQAQQQSQPQAQAQPPSQPHQVSSIESMRRESILQRRAAKRSLEKLRKQRSYE